MRRVWLLRWNDFAHQLRPFLGVFPGLDCKTHPKDGVRPFLAAMPPPPMPDPSVVKVENLTIKGPDGDDLRLLVLRPSGSTTLPEGTPVVREQREHLFHFGQLISQPPMSPDRCHTRRWRHHGVTRVGRRLSGVPVCNRCLA